MTNVENKVQMKVVFLYLEPLPLNTNIKLSNKASLLYRIKRSFARLLLLSLLSLKDQLQDLCYYHCYHLNV